MKRKMKTKMRRARRQKDFVPLPIGEMQTRRLEAVAIIAQVASFLIGKPIEMPPKQEFRIYLDPQPVGGRCACNCDVCAGCTGKTA